MEVFKTKLFSKWAKDALITDQSLIETVDEIEKGLIDADLGSNLIKKRIANKGRGKRGGTRVILAYKVDEFMFFLFGFEKSKRANITKKDLEALKMLSKTFLSMSNDTIKKLVSNKEIIHLKYRKSNE